ncbi:MAG TPA: type IV secretion system DNA-binding domain-containing protein [Vicinamibacterales bacterium]|nr:type IV secretion system DNA-binding domain-containing protein [Vicinamibacterales bacterium]
MAHLQKHVHVGAAPDGRDVFLPLAELKRTSMHIIGAAGYGKSYFLRNLMRHFLRFGQPFALIDPHRELFDFAVAAVRRSSIAKSRVTIIDPGDGDYAVAFNPLACGVDDPGEASSLVLEAVLKAWGAASFDQTPRMEGLLRGVFRLLVENQLTLLEGPQVLDIDNVALRRTLAARVSDPWVREDFEAFEKWPRNEKSAIVESSRNRLRRFLQSESVRRMLGQQQRALNMQALMDSGGVLLANVGNTKTPEVKRLLGALLVNAIFHAGKQRDPKRRRDFFVIVDECGQFATSDLANSLDELRKFGVHFVLAHQRLRQLEREDGDVLSSVMTNAKIKIVFGGLERPEAERMARDLFTGAVDGDEVKHIAMQTKFRPIDSTFEVQNESWSESGGSSETSGRSTSASVSSSESETASYRGEGIVLGSPNELDTWSRTNGSSNALVEGSSSSRVSSQASGSSGSRSVVPVTLHEEFVEETGRTFYSLEEQWERRISLVHGLAKREVFVKIHNSEPIRFRTVDVPEFRDERQTEQFKTTILSRSPHVQATAAVDREIRERQRALDARVEAAEEDGRPFAIRTFRE